MAQTQATEVLRLGSKGVVVSNLQVCLKSAGFYNGSIDGIYGTEMIRAIKSFQSRFNLTKDGVVGPKTWGAVKTNLIPRARPSAQKPPPFAKPAISVLRKVKVWWNTFIPMAMINGPPGSDCFTGDDRTFSNVINASHRSHQEIEVDVASMKLTIDWKHIGETHEVDCKTGAVKGQNTAPTSQLTNGPVSRSGSTIKIQFTTAAKNPLVTFAPAIDANVTFQIDLNARKCWLTGQHDGFPAYEAYVTADGGAGVLVYSYDPSAHSQTPSALFPPAEIKVNSPSVLF